MLDLRLERLGRGGVVQIGSDGRLGSWEGGRASDEGVEERGRRRRWSGGRRRLKLCWLDVLLYELGERLDGRVFLLFGDGREGFPCCRREERTKEKEREGGGGGELD